MIKEESKLAKPEKSYAQKITLRNDNSPTAVFCFLKHFFVQYYFVYRFIDTSL